MGILGHTYSAFSAVAAGRERIETQAPLGTLQIIGNCN
jgi:hypothetical protein